MPAPLLAVLAGLTYAALSHAVTVVTAFGGSEGTTFWPGAGITIAFLLWRPRGEWPWILSAVWIAEFSLNTLSSGLAVGLSAGWAFANTVEPLVGATILAAAGMLPLDLANRRQLLGFVGAAVLVGPSIGAFVGVGTGVLTNFYDFWPAYGRWFVGDAVGALVVAPMVLTLATVRPRDGSSMRVCLSYVGVLGALSLLVTGPWHVPWGGALPYLLLPALALTALRTGLTGAVLGVGVVALTVNAMTAAGNGPFSVEDSVSGLIEAQAFLAAGALSALVVSALTRDLISREELDRAKDIFVQTVAHDLRNPLGVIGGFASILESNGSRLSSEEQSKIIRRISTTSDRMLKLLGAVLDVDRLASGRLGPVREEVDVNEVVREVVRAMHADEHEIVVDEEPLFASVGVLELERIVENLVANAIEHTPAGTTIWVRSRADDGEVALVVEDSGPGIPEHIRSRVFEPFTRARGSGQGLGLALVAHFARTHGGTVWTERSPAGGAAFHVTLATPDGEGTRLVMPGGGLGGRS